MREKLSVAELPINASPMAEHRRQMLRQVWAPLIGSIVIVLLLVILTIVGAVQGSPQIERWGNVSAVLIILPVLLVGLVLLILTAAMAFGVTKLLGKMPDWMLRLQLRMIHISLAIRRASNAATKPVFKANTTSARIRALWNRFARKKPAATTRL
jgi:hypothetical protein